MYGAHKIYISDGKYSGTQGKGIYEFIISSPVSWTLTFYPTEESKTKIIRYIAKKTIPEAPQSFFSRYGLIIMVMAFFYSTRFMNLGGNKTQPKKK